MYGFTCISHLKISREHKARTVQLLVVTATDIIGIGVETGGPGPLTFLFEGPNMTVAPHF